MARINGFGLSIIFLGVGSIVCDCIITKDYPVCLFVRKRDCAIIRV